MGRPVAIPELLEQRPDSGGVWCVRRQPDAMRYGPGSSCCDYKAGMRLIAHAVDADINI